MNAHARVTILAIVVASAASAAGVAQQARRRTQEARTSQKGSVARFMRRIVQPFRQVYSQVHADVRRQQAQKRTAEFYAWAGPLIASSLSRLRLRIRAKLQSAVEQDVRVTMHLARAQTLLAESRVSQSGAALADGAAEMRRAQEAVYDARILLEIERTLRRDDMGFLVSVIKVRALGKTPSNKGEDVEVRVLETRLLGRDLYHCPSSYRTRERERTCVVGRR